MLKCRSSARNAKSVWPATAKTRCLQSRSTYAKSAQVAQLHYQHEAERLKVDVDDRQSEEMGSLHEQMANHKA